MAQWAYAVSGCRFSDSIADALKGRIRVVTIFPALVHTEMTRYAALQACLLHGIFPCHACRFGWLLSLGLLLVSCHH